MADSTSPVPQVIEGTGAVAKVNTLTDAASNAMAGGRDATTTALLVAGYLGGRINGTAKASGTVTLTASNTNYVVMAKSGLAVTTSTATTNWNDSANYWRLYSFVTSSTTATSWNDERLGPRGLFQTGLGVGSDGQVLTMVSGALAWANSASGFSNPMTTIGDLIVGSTAGAAIRLANGTAGQVLTAVAGAPPAWADPVAPTVPQNSQSAAYTLVLADAGKHILHPSADTTARVFTIPANSSVAYPIGTALTFVNQNAAGVITIAITADTMRLAGAGTTGSRTLAANGIATALKITSTEWIVSGTGLT